MHFGYAAVIFDFFGTLTTAMKRGPAHDLAALALGCDPVAFGNMLDRTYTARASGRYGDARTTMRRLAMLLGCDPSAEEVDEAVRLKTLAIRDGIQLRPDALHTLSVLRGAGLRTGLVSDCTEELPDLVRELPIADLLDAKIFSVRHGVTKPHPALFLAVCGRLRVHPWQCLYVGDGGGRELSGATTVGMTAVRLASPDLVEHLVFDRDRDWTGRTALTLADVLDLALTARSAPVGL